MELFKDCVACASRRLGCHSDCEKYARDKARCDEVKNARFKMQERNDAIYEVLKRR